MSDLTQFEEGSSSDIYPVMVITTIPVDQPSDWTNSLVSEQLAACVTKFPIGQSTFRWKNEIVTESETVCLIKSTSQRITELVNAIKKLHPYEVPEILILKVTGVNQAYFSWLLESTTEK